MVAAFGKILIRRYRPGDEEEINRLYNLVFQEQRPLEEWRWKFQGNPVGFSLGMAITVAEVEGRIVGQYANLVIPFKFRDRVVLATQPVDNLIHPEFRGAGVLQFRLFALQPSSAREDGVAFGFGFPNEIAYSIGKWILKYRDLFPLPTLFRRLNWRHGLRRRFPKLPAWILELVRLLSPGLYLVSLTRRGKEDIVVREGSTFDERIDTFWEGAKENYGVLAIRDRRYLNWRYVAKPSDQYTILIGERHGVIVGYTVLKVKQEAHALIGLIVDFLSVEDETVAQGLVRAALRWFLSRKVDYVLCRMLKEDRVYRALAKHGFREDPIFPPVPVVYYVFSSEIDERFLKDPRHWHLTFGDSDGV